MFNGFRPTKSLLAICVFLKQKKLEPSVLAEQFDMYDPSMYVSVMICTVEPVCYGCLFGCQLCFKSHKSIPIALAHEGAPEMSHLQSGSKCFHFYAVLGTKFAK